MDFLAFGLPRAGVMDRYAARMANLLCGNPLTGAVIEMTLRGGVYRFKKACRVAVCGAEMELKLNGKVISTWEALDVSEGDHLELAYAGAGCRAYLAVSGGINVPLVMGSRSTYLRAQLGGFLGRRLQAGDSIPMGEAPPLAVGPIRLDARFIPEYTENIKLRVLLGPQDDLFTAEGIGTFLHSSFIVSDEADRMGYRLEGPPVQHRDKADIVSDALCCGAIQIPGNGQPIVMMADCGTTGGYAKIATIIGADLWKLAQAKPQNCITFSRCTEAEAVEAFGDEVHQYRQVAAAVATGPIVSPAGKRNARRMEIRINQNTFKVDIEEVE